MLKKNAFFFGNAPNPNANIFFWVCLAKFANPFVFLVGACKTKTPRKPTQQQKKTSLLAHPFQNLQSRKEPESNKGQREKPVVRGSIAKRVNSTKSQQKPKFCRNLTWVGCLGVETSKEDHFCHGGRPQTLVFVFLIFLHVFSLSVLRRLVGTFKTVRESQNFRRVAVVSFLNVFRVV